MVILLLLFLIPNYNGLQIAPLKHKLCSALLPWVIIEKELASFSTMRI